MSQYRHTLREAVSIGATCLALALPLGREAEAEPVSTANIVAYTAAVAICLTEEGYASSKDAAVVAREILEPYMQSEGIGWDRINRILSGKNFRERALQIVKAAGGCEALLRRWMRP